ncbi:HK97 family phage prohead protease [Amycolatopsis sp. NPDC004772]
MTMDELRQAASRRALGVRAPADRPSQRRCAEQTGSLPLARVRVREMELRDSSDGKLKFVGYASVTDAAYEMYDLFGPYSELVTNGAFAKSLSFPDLDVPLVLQHQDLRRIARTTNGTLTLAEDDNGLLVEADLDPEDADVRYIAPKLRSGLIDEMSFKFRITSGQWSPDWMEYHINEVDIHRGDVAIVGYGANPHTAGATLRTQDPMDVVRELTDEQARSAFDLLTARFQPAAPEIRAEPEVRAAEPSKTSRVLITDEDVRERVIR